TDPNAHVAVAAGIPLPAAIVAVVVAVDGTAVERKAAKTAVEACAMKLAAVEGKRPRPAVPSHREFTATESATAESPTPGAPPPPAVLFPPSSPRRRFPPGFPPPLPPPPLSPPPCVRPRRVRRHPAPTQWPGQGRPLHRLRR